MPIELRTTVNVGRIEKSMGQNKREMEELLLRQQHETELLKESLKKADEQEKENQKNPLLPLEEVIQQMGTGMISFPDAPMRIRLGRYFDDHVAIPIPIDYLKEYSNENGVVTLLNDAMGISLTLQYTISKDDTVSFKSVKTGLVNQMKASGIYIELLEEGTVEDEKAPVHFITYRMPTARGVMFQMVFYAIHKEHKGMVIGNYNCFYKDLPIWENVIKATVSYFTFE